MSILENLKIKAAWYNPDIQNTQDKPIFGTLNVDELETFQITNISESMESFKSDLRFKKIPILHGVGLKTATLLDIIQTKSESNMTDFKIVTYRCSDVILNIHYKKTDKLKNISFSYPFVWGPFTNEKLEENTPHYKINQTINMSDSMKLHIGQNSGSSHSILEEKTTQSEFFKIEANPEKELDEMMKYLKSINHFLRLCTGEIIFPKRIHGIINQLRTFEYYPYWLIQYHQNKKFRNQDLLMHTIINYFDIKDNFEAIIKKWVELWFKTYEIMYDFFNIEESNMSLNTTFTEQSHVLQRFYDSIENKRNEFRKIINWYLDLCPNKMKENIIKDDFVDKIINTRNYNVHGNDVNEKYVIKEGIELKYLTDDLKTLTEIFLVSQLPITNKNSMLEKIYKNNNYARAHPIS